MEQTKVERAGAESCQLGTCYCCQTTALSKIYSKEGENSGPPFLQKEKEPALWHQPHVSGYNILFCSVLPLLQPEEPEMAEQVGEEGEEAEMTKQINSKESELTSFSSADF